MEPSLRKKQILTAVIENYINTGEPVGSKTLLSENQLGVSSATVRNEMLDLTNKGFLHQPHISAGRVPTDKGYRYYVDNIIQIKPVSTSGREYIEARMYENADSPESVLQTAVTLVSEITNLTTVATTPSGEDSRVHRISCVQTGSHTAMVVLIASNGVIKTKLFRCEFEITPEILQVFDKALNNVFSGRRISSVNRPFIQTVAANLGELTLFMPGVLSAILECCEKARQISICKSSFTRLLYSAEEDLPVIRGLIDFLNNEHDLSAMLTRLPFDTTVSIGRENSRVELAFSSVVSTGYSIDNSPSGILAVIGALRMDYAKVISVLQTVAEYSGKIIGELVRI